MTWKKVVKGQKTAGYGRVAGFYVVSKFFGVATASAGAQ